MIWFLAFLYVAAGVFANAIAVHGTVEKGEAEEYFTGPVLTFVMLFSVMVIWPAILVQALLESTKERRS